VAGIIACRFARLAARRNAPAARGPSTGLALEATEALTILKCSTSCESMNTANTTHMAYSTLRLHARHMRLCNLADESRLRTRNAPEVHEHPIQQPGACEDTGEREQLVRHDSQRVQRVEETQHLSIVIAAVPHRCDACAQ
jgi:hypothetical protein